MFVLTTIADTVRIPPSQFFRPTLSNVHDEIDKKYPNRVVMDVGLVVCRYGEALRIGDGVCVPGDGGSHHEIVFRLVVFRPFVEEVIVGTIAESTEEGIRVSVGEFFDDVFVPAYWMLRPSHFDGGRGIWVWTPEDEDENENNEGGGGGGGERFEMDVGSEIRFRVKSLNFTRVTNTAKGVQATTTTTSHSTAATANVERTLSGKGGGGGDGKTTGGKNDEPNDNSRPVRKRSTSVDLSDARKLPASMHVVGSICEDGLGLTAWWSAAADDEEEEAEEEEGGGEEGYEEGEGEYDEGDEYGEEYE